MSLILLESDEVSPFPPAIDPSIYFTSQFRNDKIVYRRYAGLFFCVCVDSNDNELAYLEAIHLFVEVLGESTRADHRSGLREAGRSLVADSWSRCVLPECLRAGSGVLVLQSGFWFPAEYSRMELPEPVISK